MHDIDRKQIWLCSPRPQRTYCLLPIATGEAQWKAQIAPNFKCQQHLIGLFLKTAQCIVLLLKFPENTKSNIGLRFLLLTSILIVCHDRVLADSIIMRWKILVVTWYSPMEISLSSSGTNKESFLLLSALRSHYSSSRDKQWLGHFFALSPKSSTCVHNEEATNDTVLPMRRPVPERKKNRIQKNTIV